MILTAMESRPGSWTHFKCYIDGYVTFNGYVTFDGYAASQLQSAPSITAQVSASLSSWTKELSGCHGYLGMLVLMYSSPVQDAEKRDPCNKRQLFENQDHFDTDLRTRIRCYTNLKIMRIQT